MTVSRQSGRDSKCSECGEVFHFTLEAKHDPCVKAPKVAPKKKK